MSRKGTFLKAIHHLKSTEIDEKIQKLDEQPTNNTMGYMTATPNTPNPDFVHRAQGQFNAQLAKEPDFDADDPDLNGKDTSGLFEEQDDGTVIPRVALPPITNASPDNSYILGPMAAMYYTWSYPWTMIGYIRESDRKVVDLARIDGKLSDWDGVTGFRNDWWGGQLTLEQAVWFRDVKKYGNVGNDPDNANYRAFYPGPPSNSPDAFGRYYCITTGEYKNRDQTDVFPDPGRTGPTPVEPTPDEILAAIMDRIRKRAKLSNKEKEWLWDNDLGYLLPPDQRTDPRDDPDYGSQSQSSDPNVDKAIGHGLSAERANEMSPAELDRFVQMQDNLQADIDRYGAEEKAARKEMRDIAIGFGVDVALTLFGGAILKGAAKGISLGAKALKNASRAKNIAKAADAAVDASKINKAVQAAKKGNLVRPTNHNITGVKNIKTPTKVNGKFNVNVKDAKGNVIAKNYKGADGKWYQVPNPYKGKGTGNKMKDLADKLKWEIGERQVSTKQIQNWERTGEPLKGWRIDRLITNPKGTGSTFSGPTSGAKAVIDPITKGIKGATNVLKGAGKKLTSPIKNSLAGKSYTAAERASVTGLAAMQATNQIGKTLDADVQKMKDAIPKSIMNSKGGEILGDMIDNVQYARAAIGSAFNEPQTAAVTALVNAVHKNINDPKAQGLATAWNSLMSHKDNNNPASPNFRIHDPTSKNYVGPKQVKMTPTVHRAVTNRLNQSLYKLNGGKGPSNPNGKLTAAEIDAVSKDMKYSHEKNLENGKNDPALMTFYNNFHSLPPDKTTFNVKGGKFVDMDSNYVFTDPRDANPFAVKLPGLSQKHSDVITNFATELLHGVGKQAVSNKKIKGGSKFYNKEKGEPNRKAIGKQFNTQMGLKAFTSMKESYVPVSQVIVLTESRKSILKNLKKPVVLPKEPKKFKVKPKLRTPNNWMGSTPKISKPVDTPKEYKQVGGRNLWGKEEYNYNTTQSQERMNQVYELVGSGNMAFDHMLTDSKKMNDEQMEKFWGKNQDLYSYFYGGKKYKLVRKEAMDGDYLVFLIDDHGEKSNILQSELNEKLAEEQQKKELEEYNKMNPKNEPISFEKDYMFKKAYQKLKPQVEYKGKPAKKGYPEDPPPEMVNNRHPDFGKMPGSTYYNKLDPQSAAAMPQQDDPLVDAKAKDAKENPKKDSAIFRRKLDDKMKKERERLNKEEWETSDWRKELEIT